MFESVRETIASVPLTVVGEAALTTTAAVAGLRRFFPKIDGWYVVFAVVACCLLAGWGTYGWDARAVVLAVWTFCLAYGGYNGVRRLIEQGAKALQLVIEAVLSRQPIPSVPPPPSLATKSDPPPSEGPP